MRTAVASTLLAAVVVAPLIGAQPPEESAPTTEEIVERILELREEIEVLLAALPKAERAALRRRLEEWQGAADAPLREPTSTAGESPPPPLPTAAPPVEPPSSDDAPDAAAAPPPRDEAWRERARTAPRCNTLLAFDSDGDGSVSGADRYWRHLYLWVDEDADGSMIEDEIRHLFEHDVHALSVDLDRYTGREGISGDVDVGATAIRLLLFSSKRDVEGVLVLDASGLARGGELELVGAEGTPLTGFRAFAPGQALRRNGEAVPLDCP